MAFWLRYYDNFYEAVRNQSVVTEVEIGKANMAPYDVVVDAFLVWYDWKAKEKSKERESESGTGYGDDRRDSHEARPPRVLDHKQVYRAAH
jgi:hypothetical protein